MGDIGTERRHIEVLPATEPVDEPAPTPPVVAPAPRQPVRQD